MVKIKTYLLFFTLSDCGGKGLFARLVANPAILSVAGKPVFYPHI
jgi:hypothetical protein